MIIAIATDGRYVSPHFGRCQAYTLVDVEGRNVVFIEQVDNPGHAPGAIPEFLYKKGAQKIVCGGIGARATELFGQYGIDIVAGTEGRIEEILDRLADGTLSGGKSVCTPGEGRGYGVEKTECDHAHEES